MAEERRTAEDSKDISIFLDEGNTEEPEKQTFRLRQVDLTNDAANVDSELRKKRALSSLGQPLGSL